MEVHLKNGSNARFPFPHSPYEIQENFMIQLYKTLEEKELGIFESPTGTGKSLSIIFGVLCWLKDHEEYVEKKIVSDISEIEIEHAEIENKTTDDDWLSLQAKLNELRQKKQSLKHQLKLIQENKNTISFIKDKILKNKEQKQNIRESNDSFSIDSSVEQVNDSEDAFLLEEVEPQEQEFDINNDDDDVAEKIQDEYKSVKVYFCSRTHSQLSQFIREVQRSSFKDEIRLVPLASRQNYCINPAVKKLKNISLINERCLDLQKNKTEKITKKGSSEETVKRKKCGSNCPYNNKEAITKLGEEIITSVCDIEELVAKGMRLKACPYYATRSVLPLAQLVVVPYNTILHKSTRDASQIILKDNVVIIDEAHNLLDAIGNMYGAQIAGYQLCRCYSQLSQYKSRYERHFSSFNLLYLNQLILVIGQLISAVGGKADCNPVENSRKGVDTKIYTLAEFVHMIEIDNINIFKLLSFCQRSKITQKLHGFNEQYASTSKVNITTKPSNSGLRNFLKHISVSDNNKSIKVTEIPSENESSSRLTDTDNSNNPILPVLSFIEMLTNHCEDGRIVCNQQITVGRGSLKYLLLNPAAHFKDIISEARAVVVAGGTMQPISEFKDQLFKRAGADPSRIVTFSCGHVIPPENILPIVLSSGPSGKQLDFSFQSRTSLAMLNELSRIIINICNVVPAGIVCFFPSYEYEEIVFKHLERNHMIETISKKKKVFREPKKTSEIDTVLSEYSAAILRKKCTNKSINGALMFSVIGGKLSEGLNFSDGLGRAVIIVGLPYPNIKNVELQEKMKYLDATVGPGSGQQHYENLCMKAVNQSIGRAVRHKLDYATVLLLDHRYSRSGVLDSLPQWMKASLKVIELFGPAFSSISKFFKGKNDCNVV